MFSWKKIARWAEQQAEEAERNKAAKLAKRDLAKQREENKFKSPEKPATQAFVYNTAHSLEGVICKLFEASGTMLIKSNKDISDAQFDDIRSLVCEQLAKTDEHIDGHVASLSAELVDVLKAVSDAHTENLARVHEDIVGGQRMLHNVQTKFIGEIGEAVAKTEHRVSVLQFDTNRQFLETIQHMREGRIEAFALTETLFAAMQVMDANINKRLDAIEANTQKRKRREEPPLEWLIENYDELARFVKGVEAMRNNDAPPQMAMLESVRSIKCLGDYPTGVIKEAIETQLLAA